MYVSTRSKPNVMIDAITYASNHSTCDDGCKYNRCGFCEMLREDLSVFGGCRHNCDYYNGGKIDKGFAKSWRATLDAAIEKAKKQMAADGWPMEGKDNA